LELRLGQREVEGSEVGSQPSLLIEKRRRDAGEGARPGLVERGAEDSGLALLGVAEGPLQVPCVPGKAPELELDPDRLVVRLARC
jgi:hypothetical protein